MFNNDSVLSYIKKILEKSSSQEEGISLIKDFRKYLELTKMADDETLEYVDSLIEAVPSFYNLSSVLDKDELLGVLDSSVNDTPKKKTKSKKKTYEDRHYDNYGSYDNAFNYSCNSGRGFNGCCSSQSSSYSSSCGSSGSYRSGC